VTILVLGVGGNVGQGILKALAASRLPCRIIGACIYPTSMGLYTTDRSYISPAAKDPAFIAWLLDICRRERIQGILSGVEPVLEVISPQAEQIRQETGAVAVVSRPEQLALCLDKLATSRWLESEGLNYPETEEVAAGHPTWPLVQRCGYPLVAKPRRGKGSDGLFVLRNENDLRMFQTRPDYVVQQYLGEPSEEYTAATFTDRQGQLRGVIVMRRRLEKGTTVSAELGHFPEVREQVRCIAEALRPVGPCNMQLRMHCGKPVCFEINLRFSGTAPIRARFGFNDVEAAVRHYVLGEPANELTQPTQGVALRYWNELYVNSSRLDELAYLGMLAQPRDALACVEDYGIRR
jgi:carbamoyl-phosphate synthase large subunit